MSLEAWRWAKDSQCVSRGLKAPRQFNTLESFYKEESKHVHIVTSSMVDSSQATLAVSCSYATCMHSGISVAKKCASLKVRLEVWCMHMKKPVQSETLALCIHARCGVNKPTFRQS